MQQAGDNQNEIASAELNRLAGDGETVGGRAMPVVPIDRADGVELWGRRIGRTLGWLFAAFLLYQLIMAYSS